MFGEGWRRGGGGKWGGYGVNFVGASGCARGREGVGLVDMMELDEEVINERAGGGVGEGGAERAGRARGRKGRRG